MESAESTQLVRWLLFIMVICIAIVLCSLLAEFLSDTGPATRRTKAFIRNVVSYPARWHRKYCDEVRVSREWELGYYERRRAAGHLLSEYRVIIPEYLLLCRHGGEGDLYNVRQITTPMLIELASRHKKAVEHQRELGRKMGEGEKLSRHALYYAQCQVEKTFRQLRDFWCHVHMCRIYPGMKWASTYQEILDHLEKK